MKFLTDDQLSELLPAETASFPSPVPTQIVSSDEYMPAPQTAKQREVEARLKELSDRLARLDETHQAGVVAQEMGVAIDDELLRQRLGPLGRHVRCRRLGSADLEETAEHLVHRDE